MNKIISYGKQLIEEDDINSVIDVLKSDNLTQGPKIGEFEQSICDYTGSKYCAAVANGTAALHIAVAALNIEKGSQGITSPITFVATSNSLIYNGLKPEFSDIDERTYNIGVDSLENKISDKTRLIMPVHFAGQPADMEAIQRIAKKNNLKIIEDAAHAIGSKYKDGSCIGNCKYSDMTIFSFHPVKTITTGEGGAITTNDFQLYRRLLLLRSHGITKETKLLSENPGPWYYEMQDIGYNYRLTDLQAALGISQIKKLERFKRRRREIVRRYNESFQKLNPVTIPYEDPKVESCFHLYVLKIDFEKINKDRRQFMEELRRKNIGAQVHYIPVHTHPFYRKNFGYKWGDYPKAEEYYSKALSLPLYPAMIDEDVEYVIHSFKEIIG